MENGFSQPWKQPKVTERKPVHPLGKSFVLLVGNQHVPLRMLLRVLSSNHLSPIKKRLLISLIKTYEKPLYSSKKC